MRRYRVVRARDCCRGYYVEKRVPFLGIWRKILGSWQPTVEACELFVMGLEKRGKVVKVINVVE